MEVAKRVKAYDRSDRNDEKTDSLSPLFSQIQPLSPLLDEIRRCVVGEDEIADDASAALSKIRKSIRGMNDRIHAQLTGLMNNTTTRSYLQDAVITMRDVTQSRCLRWAGSLRPCRMKLFSKTA